MMSAVVDSLHVSMVGRFYKSEREGEEGRGRGGGDGDGDGDEEINSGTVAACITTKATRSSIHANTPCSLLPFGYLLALGLYAACTFRVEHTNVSHSLGPAVLVSPSYPAPFFRSPDKRQQAVTAWVELSMGSCDASRHPQTPSRNTKTNKLHQLFYRSLV